MAIHVFAALVTPLGTASNNRGENEGNITTLQKLVWEQQVHTTVSAEAIRFALRRRLAEASEPCNRSYNDDTRANEWKDPTFERWGEKSKETVFADDDLLGFMAAEGAKEEGGKGTAKIRRAVLEVTRAVSLTPWPGDTTFNAASPGATPSAQKKGTSNPVPYQAELHATRYQYGIALTPGRLRVAERAQVALRHLCALGEVAGNHGRFLYDFSPESVVFRITHDAAPRILYSFRQHDERQVSFPELVRKVKAGDVKASELVIGGAVLDVLSKEDRLALEGAALLPGVVAACEEACKRLKQSGAQK
jgi:CRISPR-associated protein Cst2